MNVQLKELLKRSNVTTRAADAIDCSAWIGSYPFRGIPRSGASDLKACGKALGISKFIVSPFEAVFWENGLRAYEHSAEEMAGEDSLEVWPVVRPGDLFGLEALLDHYSPCGVRLVPNYHGYALSSSSVAPIFDLARERGMVVQIFTRLADERWHYLLKVPELSMMDLEYAFSVFDRQPILVSGLNRPQALADRMKQHPSLYADVSRVRGPAFGMDQLLETGPVDRLVFGSHWPIQVIESTLWQITSSRTKQAVKDRVLHQNAGRLLAQAGMKPKSKKLTRR